MANTMIMDHPLIQHKIGLIRRKDTGTKDFRQTISEIAMLICYEATRELKLGDVEIETPICKTMAKELQGKKMAIVPILRAGLGLVWAVCLPVAAAYLLAGRQLLCLFIDAPTQTALDTGVTFLRLLSPFYFVVSAKLTADGVLRGTGSMGRFMAATFTDLILRVVLSFLLSGWTGSALGIWCSWPVGWTIATGMSLFFYRRACRRLGA